jgi:hypothetical protein
MNPNDNNSLAHTTWNCKYHIVFAPKYLICYPQSRQSKKQNSDRTGVFFWLRQSYYKWLKLPQSQMLFALPTDAL